MRRVLACSLLCSVALLTSCDIVDAIQRPPELIHMYGEAVDVNTFQPIPKAQIAVKINNKTQRFVGSYDVQVPVNQTLVITATAPGYQPYQIRTALNPQGSQELRSPLMLRPLKSR